MHSLTCTPFLQNGRLETYPKDSRPQKEPVMLCGLIRAFHSKLIRPNVPKRPDRSLYKKARSSWALVHQWHVTFVASCENTSSLWTTLYWSTHDHGWKAHVRLPEHARISLLRRVLTQREVWNRGKRSFASRVLCLLIWLWLNGCWHFERIPASYTLWRYNDVTHRVSFGWGKGL